VKDSAVALEYRMAAIEEARDLENPDLKLRVGNRKGGVGSMDITFVWSG